MASLAVLVAKVSEQPLIKLIQVYNTAGLTGYVSINRNIETSSYKYR